MSAKHTPGPWAAFTADEHTNIVAMKPRTACVFSLPGRDKNDPDVRLIAAAPELLVALVDLQELAALLAANCTDRVDVTNDQRVARARAAIAKATGEQA